MHLDFLYTPVSWVLLRWHSLFTAIGIKPTSGANWALSIIFLVITARLLLFRLFVKQIKYQRHMQQLQPQIQKLREKYKNDRAAMQREMMKLQQEQGFNPLAGCLPMFLQIPVFISLFHVLRHISNSVTLCNAHDTGRQVTLYTFTATQTCNASQAKLFGGAPLAGSLRDSQHVIVDLLGGDITTTRIVTIVLVLVSAGATFMTQRLALSAATTVPTGTAATVQKLMRVGIPASVLISGIFFPLGTLLYWFTSNTWTMLQQLYVNRFHPATPKDAPEVGAVGKSLAPKPGQRPARTRTAPAKTDLSKPARPAADLESGDDTNATDAINGAEVTSGDASTSGTAGSGAPRSSTPKPGQRPQRPQGRGSTKRPSQAKKRR